MDWVASPEIWIALVTLTALEIVLGIDNVIFISILSGKLPVEQQKRARNLGLSLAMLTRILLLLSIAWIIKLTEPLFSVFGEEFSSYCCWEVPFFSGRVRSRFMRNSRERKVTLASVCLPRSPQSSSRSCCSMSSFRSTR